MVTQIYEFYVNKDAKFNNVDYREKKTAYVDKLRALSLNVLIYDNFKSK